MRTIHRLVFGPVLAGVLALVGSPVLAQTQTPPPPQPPQTQTQAVEEPSTRASLMQSAREVLARESAPPKRSTVERALYWYDNQFLVARAFGGWHGIHLAGADFPAGAGLKIGLGYNRGLTQNHPEPGLPNRLDLGVRGAYSTSSYKRFGAGLHGRNLADANLDISVSSQYYEFPQEDFFGLGMDSVEENRTNYLVEALESGVTAEWKPSRLQFGGGVAYFTPRVAEGTDSLYPTTGDLFTVADAPGLRTKTDFLKADLSAAFDWRDNPSHPHAGGRYGVAVTNFDDRTLGRYDFYRVDVNVQQYVPLPDRYRLLALSAHGVFTHDDDDRSVPFYLQPTLGGASELRGFRESRYRDRNSVVVSAEYRWEAWWALDAALFIDAGMVASSYESLSVRDAEVGYGIGFRFHGNKAFAARLDLAFSREGFIPLLRFEHVF